MVGITTERLLLRPLEVADREAFVALSERSRTHRRGSRSASRARGCSLAIIDRAADTFYGDSAVRALTDQPETAEIGVTLARSSQEAGEGGGRRPPPVRQRYLVTVRYRATLVATVHTTSDSMAGKNA